MATQAMNNNLEAVARALCIEDGRDPDRLEPGDDPYMGREGYPSPCVDGVLPNDDKAHFLWRNYVFAAQAAINALPDIGVLVEALVDIRNRVLCPVGPAPTIDELGEIASAALERHQ